MIPPIMFMAARSTSTRSWSPTSGACARSAWSDSRAIARTPARRDRAAAAPRGSRSRRSTSATSSTALRKTDPTLAGKNVLVVDDDVRNIFALTSVLEEHNLQVVHAENGRAGIEMLLKDARHRLVS